MSKQVIHTENAPQAIGCYSQAVRAGNTVYFSGQIGLNPTTMELVDGFEPQTHQVFKNLSAVANACGGSLSQIVKLNIFLTDMNNFAIVNKIMAEYFSEPYPARAAIGVKELPKGSLVEADGIMVLD
ncbi:MAG: RidA family protein [Neisseriaceae bacterium]